MTTYHIEDAAAQIEIFKANAVSAIEAAKAETHSGIAEEEQSFKSTVEKIRATLCRQVRTVTSKAKEWREGRSKYTPHQGKKEKARRLSKWCV